MWNSVHLHGNGESVYVRGLTEFGLSKCQKWKRRVSSLLCSTLRVCPLWVHVSGLWKWHELVMTTGFKFHLSILQDSEVPVESDNG